MHILYQEIILKSPQWLSFRQFINQSKYRTTKVIGEKFEKAVTM
jgi:hypothetical protein